MKKKLIVLFLGIFVLVIISGCTTTSQGPAIKLSHEKYNLGDVSVEAGLKEASFTVTNTGSAVLNIVSVSTSCGCTTASVDDQAILPGQSSQLRVIYDPAVHPDLRGKLKRVIYIQSNDPANEEVELELTANQVGPDEHEEIDTHEDNLADFEVSPFTVKEKKGDVGVKLLDVREDNEYEENHLEGALLLSVTKITEESLAALGLEKDDEIILYCRSGKRSAKAYEVMKALGYTNIKSMNGGIVHWMEEGLPVETGKPRNQELAVGTATVVLEEESFDFGVVKQSEGVVNTTFVITNQGAHDLELSSVSTSCGCTSAVLDTEVVKSGQNAVLTVFFDPNVHDEPLDKFSRTVFIETNDPTQPEIEVKVFVDIAEGQ